MQSHPPLSPVQILLRKVELAAMLRTIEPEELSRVELLSLLGIIAASAELSAALLDDLGDRGNREAIAVAGRLDLAATIVEAVR